MAIKVIAKNKKAYFNFEILEKIEAGIVLMGSEVKSLRAGQCQLKDSYVVFIRDEVFLQKVHISPYKMANAQNHEPERLRKLLLHRKEIARLYGLLREKGQTCIPLQIYFKKGKIKVELGLGRGKKTRDRRETIKKREDQIKIQKALKR